MWNELARTGDDHGATNLGMIFQQGDDFHETQIQYRGCVRVFRCDVLLDLDTVVERFGRPVEFHP